MEIYQKSFDIIEQYFGSEEEDGKIAPVKEGHEYAFNPEKEGTVTWNNYNF